MNPAEDLPPDEFSELQIELAGMVSLPNNPVTSQPVNPFDQPPTTTPPPPPPPRKVGGARLVVLDTVYHQRTDEQPTHVPSVRYSRLLYTAEQPFVREFTAGPEWTPLETGWLEAAGLLVLRNLEGTNLSVIPTRQERDDIASRVLEVGVEVPVPDAGRRTQWSPPRPAVDVVGFALVRPGTGVNLEPIDVKRVRVRCRAGKARCTLHLIPE